METSDFLTIAQSLLSDKTIAAQRTVINRSYYAALLTFSTIFKDRYGCHFSEDYQFHEEVFRELESMGWGYHHQLEELRYLRSWADYDINDIDYPSKSGPCSIQKAAIHAEQIARYIIREIYSKHQIPIPSHIAKPIE